MFKDKISERIQRYKDAIKSLQLLAYDIEADSPEAEDKALFLSWAFNLETELENYRRSIH